MTTKRLKVFSLINIAVVVSLLLNVILISQVSFYKNLTYKNVNRSLRVVKSNLTDAQEILEQIILTGKIDELQYEDIHYLFDKFEYEYKHNLYFYYCELESKNKDFSDINLLFDMNDYISNFGKEKQLSLYKTSGDNIKIIDLSENEVEHFKDIRNKNKRYINVLENYKIDRYKGYRQNWVKIVDGIYEKGIEQIAR